VSVRWWESLLPARRSRALARVTRSLAVSVLAGALGGASDREGSTRVAARRLLDKAIARERAELKAAAREAGVSRRVELENRVMHGLRATGGTSLCERVSPTSELVLSTSQWKAVVDARARLDHTREHVVAANLHTRDELLLSAAGRSGPYRAAR
jgi:hypothetical protein